MKKDICKTGIEFVCVAVCSYKRPEMLKNTLNSLLDMELPVGLRTEIIIVDNDKNQTARPVVYEFFSNSPIKINYFCEETSGLSSARNRVLTEAIALGASHLAFLDDDEVVEKDWLVEHIKFYREFENIYISSGPAFVKFEKNYPKHIMQNDIFKVASTKKYGELRPTCATNNVFFPLAPVKEHNVYFDLKFSKCGGEDGDFFARLVTLGYVIGWNDKAVNYEIVNDKRANIDWILKRHYQNGYSSSFLKFNNGACVKRFICVVEKSFTVLFNLFLVLLSLVLGKTIFFNALGLMLKNYGKLIGALLTKPHNYYS